MFGLVTCTFPVELAFFSEAQVSNSSAIQDFLTSMVNEHRN